VTTETPVRHGVTAAIGLGLVAALLVGAAATPAAAQGGGRGGDAYGFVFMMAGMVAIFYFLLWRPQQKQRKERDAMLGALKHGDRVVTTSGLHGTITKIGEHTVTLRVADQVRLEFDRSAIGRVVPAADKEPGG
jgi:preprotein translocase subunit YajC